MAIFTANSRLLSRRQSVSCQCIIFIRVQSKGNKLRLTSVKTCLSTQHKNGESLSRRHCPLLPSDNLKHAVIDIIHSGGLINWLLSSSLFEDCSFAQIRTWNKFGQRRPPEKVDRAELFTSSHKIKNK